MEPARRRAAAEMEIRVASIADVEMKITTAMDQDKTANKREVIDKIARTVRTGREWDMEPETDAAEKFEVNRSNNSIARSGI